MWPTGHPPTPNPDSSGVTPPGPGPGVQSAPGSHCPGLEGAVRTPGALAGRVSEREGTWPAPAPRVAGAALAGEDGNRRVEPHPCR